MKYTFYSYPDHSWLKVPTKQIVDLGIAEEISEWSFYSPNGNHTYLEEDVDAGKFIKAMGGINSTCKHVEHPQGRQAATDIRSYPSYYSEYALTRFA